MTDTHLFRPPIGEDVRSPRAPRLLAGRGKFTDDVPAPRIAMSPIYEALMRMLGLSPSIGTLRSSHQAFC